MHRSIAPDGNAIDEIVTGVPQDFEGRDEGGIEITGGELPGEGRGMIEEDFPVVALDQRARVEIFDAPDPQRFPARQAQINSVSVADAGFVPFRAEGARCR